eukprot:1074939-Pleurochrysis_carterae.AAC.1
MHRLGVSRSQWHETAQMGEAKASRPAFAPLLYSSASYVIASSTSGIWLFPVNRWFRVEHVCFATCRQPQRELSVWVKGLGQSPGLDEPLVIVNSPLASLDKGFKGFAPPTEEGVHSPPAGDRPPRNGCAAGAADAHGMPLCC